MRGRLFWTVPVIFLSGCVLSTKGDNASVLNGDSKEEIAAAYVCPERKSKNFDSSGISNGMGKTEVVCAFGSPERKYVNDNVELYEYVAGIDKKISYVMFLDGKVVENGEGSVLPIYHGAGKKNIPLDNSTNSNVGFKQVVVAVSSYPQGADLFEEDRFIGRAPFPFRYAVTSQNKKDGYIATKQIKARWISGATQTTMLTVNLSLGENQSYTLQRPSGAEGYEDDAKFGLQIETNMQVEQQNVINLYKAMQPSYVPSTPVYIPTPVYTPVPVYTQNKTRLKTDCISTVSGRDVFTNCR